MDEQKLKFLNAAFLEAMNDIGRHGYEKYGDDIASAESRKRGARWTPPAIGFHISEHYHDYRKGIPHDHFGDSKHQLAAVAFNAMMEFCFAGLASEVPAEKV